MNIIPEVSASHTEDMRVPIVQKMLDVFNKYAKQIAGFTQNFFWWSHLYGVMWEF